MLPPRPRQGHPTETFSRATETFSERTFCETERGMGIRSMRLPDRPCVGAPRRYVSLRNGDRLAAHRIEEA